MTATGEITIHLPIPHAYQDQIRLSRAKRLIIRAGRRGGKTVGCAIKAVESFAKGRRVLYAAPTAEQTEKFWYEVCASLVEPVKAGIYVKNETERVIERRGTENRIRAKTAWNANTLRGDYADLLILDEYQLMDEDAWGVVGAPMLVDNNGDAIFVYTPPSLRSIGVSKAHDPRHAAKLFKFAQADTTGRWQAITFSSHVNPYISQDALAALVTDMSKAAYRQEIMAEDEELQRNELVYAAFNENTCRIRRFTIPDSWPRYVGHDFGTANPAALFFAQDPATGYFYAYREYLPGTGRGTAQHVEAFKELTQGLNIIKRVGGSHQEEEIRQGYTAHGWPIQAPKLKEVKAQLDRVIALMELNKVFVFDDLYHYLEELMSCLWKRDPKGIITNKIDNEQRYHLSAAARYILSDFTPETAVPNGPARTRSSSWGGI